jgi:predicted amidohydrolase YtcJ
MPAVRTRSQAARAARLRRRVFFLLALVVFGGLGLWSALAPAPPRLFVGGPILTMDAESRVAEALAIDGDRIVGVGARADLEAWARSRGAEVVDLQGRALLPGFIDGHSHFPASGILDRFVHVGSPPLGAVADIEAMVAALREGGDADPRSDWIVGWGYDDTMLADGRHPTRIDLDRVSTARPVVAIHISLQVAAVNSVGLGALGYDDATPDPEGGVLVRDAAGRPTGVLEEEAMRPALVAALLPSTWQGLHATRRAAALYLAAGVTTAQNGAAQREQLGGLAWMARLGLLPLRLVVWPEGETAMALLDGSLEAPSGDPMRFRLGAAKLVADGSIQAYTAHFTEPYHVPPGGEAGFRGYPRIPRERLIEDVGRLHAGGVQVAVHGNGDAALDDILDAFEEAQRAAPRADARHVIVHAQTPRDDQLDRMKRLGVVPSFFELHTWYWGDRHRERFLGPERAARISPLASAKARGIRFTIHADTPVLPMEPLRMVAAAVTRRTTSGQVLGPAERLGVMDALRAVTIDAAWQHFMEDDLGSLEVGKLADLVILDRSPLDVPDAVETIRVVETIVGGRRVWVGG